LQESVISQATKTKTKFLGDYDNDKKTGGIVRQEAPSFLLFKNASSVSNKHQAITDSYSKNK
tara:strand:+ start:405 stop:590 length:186 start_codon:yes stop_codon:yes gene_type:complete